MPNYGIGIGSFLDGLTKGMALKNQQDQQKVTNDLNERRMKLSEGQDARAAQSDALSLKKAQTDLDNSQADRAATAPILAAQRKVQLDNLNDESEQRATVRSGTDQAQKDYAAEKAKSIIVGKDDAGNPTYAVDGEKAASADDADKLFEQKHGAFMDAYRTRVVPKIINGYLKRGDVKSAEAFQKWSDNKGVESATQDYGRMMQSATMGDWDGATKYLNSMATNGDAISQDRHKLVATPIKDKDGKTSGIHVDYKDNVSGQTFGRDFSDMDEFHKYAATLMSPDSLFEQGKADLAAHQAAQAEKAKGLNKLANDITLANVNSNNKMDEDQLKSKLNIAEEFAKNNGYQNPKEFANSTRDMLKNMADNDMLKTNVVGDDGKPVLKSDGTPKTRNMTADEAVTAAANLVHQTNIASRQQGAQTVGVVPQPAAAPGRSIMPQGAPAGAAVTQPTLAPPPRRQLPFFAQ
jgi:hypothetical protein